MHYRQHYCAYSEGNIAFRFGTPEKRVKEVNIDVYNKAPKINWFNLPWATATLMSV